MKKPNRHRRKKKRKNRNRRRRGRRRRRAEGHIGPFRYAVEAVVAGAEAS